MKIELSSRQVKYLVALLNLLSPDSGIFDLSDLQADLITDGYNVDEQDALADEILNTLSDAL